MTRVRAKFVCTGIVDNPEYKQKTVSFVPVINDCKENESWSKYTPSGSLEMTISYETEAVNAFEKHKEYYLDVSLAE